jgi:hypothetical protein
MTEDRVQLRCSRAAWWRLAIVVGLLGCTGSSSPTPAGIGLVTIRQDGPHYTHASASFFEPVPSVPDSRGCGCEEYEMGGCRLRGCRLDAACSGQTVPAARSFGAGPITIGLPSGLPLKLTPARETDYFAQSADGPPGDSGALVTADAAGGTVSPFHVSAPIPEPLELTEPAPTVARDQPVRVRWTPAPTGQVEAALTWQFRPDMTGRETTVTCTAPATAGELVLPAPNASDAQASLRVRRLATGVVQAGTFAVTLEVVRSAETRELRLIDERDLDAGVRD